MSYELDYTEKYKCPCGKGYWVERHYSNDWGQSETTTDIYCKICKQKYMIYEIVYYNSGLPEEIFCLILKKDLPKIQNILSSTLFNGSLNCRFSLFEFLKQIKKYLVKTGEI